MARVLLTVNGKLITSPKVGREYDFYIPDLEDLSSIDGSKIIQGVSAHQLHDIGVSEGYIISKTIEGSFSIDYFNGNYLFIIHSGGKRGTANFDVKYGKYAGYTVLGENIFRRGLLTSPQL